MPRWLYYLLATAIVAPAISIIGGSQQEIAIFICSVISLIPLAALISRATEDLEYYVGPIAGGLLNATFGNAPEIIIGIVAIQHGLITVVKASITGSILSNALLVLGMSLAAGGWRWGKQYFNARDAGQFASMMALAVAALALPATASLLIKDPGRIETMSVAISIILLFVYALYLATHIFHLHAERRIPHRLGKHAVRPPRETGDEAEEANGESEAREVTSTGTKPPPPWLTLLILCGATIGTAWNSELLVGAIEPVTKLIGWSPVFIGLVIIPIVGNATEHASALVIALKDRVDLSMAIAAGSSIQVATLVAPLLVLVGLFYSPHLDLIFQPLELLVMAAAVIVFSLISLDGETSWLAGVQLVALYLIACVVFFLIPG